MPSARIGPATKVDTAMPIRAGKRRTIGTAVEHDTALPLTAVGGSVLVIAFGNTTEELLPDGIVHWGRATGRTISSAPEPKFCSSSSSWCTPASWQIRLVARRC
jgi:hypothetical protein